ncbi:MAG: flagellar basal body-associated protein FliL [Porticoccaceae bacterium]
MAKSSAIKWLLIFLVVVLIALAGAILYLLLEGRQENVSPNTAKSPPAVAPDLIFVKIGPMTVNLASDSYGQQLLYFSLSLKTSDLQTRDIINRHMPEVQNRLLILLSGQSAEALLSSEGKERLSAQILSLFDQPFTEPQPPLAISAVLFTDFILQ